MCQTGSTSIQGPVKGYRVYNNNKQQLSVCNWWTRPELGVATQADELPFHAFRELKDVMGFLYVMGLLLSKVHIYECLLDDGVEEGCWGDDATVCTYTGLVCTIVKEVTISDPYTGVDCVHIESN